MGGRGTGGLEERVRGWGRRRRRRRRAYEKRWREGGLAGEEGEEGTRSIGGGEGGGTRSRKTVCE